MATDGGNNQSIIRSLCVCLNWTWGKFGFSAGFITFDSFGKDYNAIVLVIVLLIAQRSGLKKQFLLHRRWLLKQQEGILRSQEKLEYSLSHENSRNPLVLLHHYITAMRSKCRSMRKNIMCYKQGSFNSLLWFLFRTRRYLRSEGCISVSLTWNLCLWQL